MKPNEKALTAAFEVLWKELFQTPIHLDSALSKRPKHLKADLAEITQAILLRPVSLAEQAGVGVAPGEPWSLSPAQLVEWRPASLICASLARSRGAFEPDPSLDDFPPHLLEAWCQSWGEDTTRDLCRTLGAEPPLSLRASQRIGAPLLLKRLRSEVALTRKADLSELSPLGVRIDGYAPVLNTPLFEEGMFEIQDEGSQLMSLFALSPELYSGKLQEKPGSRAASQERPALPAKLAALTVVDACAGAGGKSLALADLLGGRGRLFSYDTSVKKLQALRRRATRAGFNNIQALEVRDGEEGQTIGKFKETADVVLVDAPCSGWGVLRRNPDIKWRQKTDTLQRMPVLQKRLLDVYSQLVKPGGRLVFGVCTFRQEETTAVVDDFLSHHPEFEKQAGGYVGPGPSSDGFFMQAFLRK